MLHLVKGLDLTLPHPTLSVMDICELGEKHLLGTPDLV